MILTLKRDDGKELALTWANGYSTEASDDWFDAKPLTNSTINYANADGGALIKQNYGMLPITVSGMVHGTTLDATRQHAKTLATFLLKNHYYTAIFMGCDGTAMASKEAFISTALAMPMLGKNEAARKYSFQITLSDPYLYEYAVDDKGNEVYANSIEIRRFTAPQGGYVYYGGGYAYYNGGYLYVGSDSTPPTVDVDSIRMVNPVWEIVGPAKNPTLTNVTTNQTISVQVTLSEGQTMLVDTGNRTAYIGTADFTDNVTGEWLQLAVGTNQLRYSTDNDDAPACKVSWNGVLL